MHPMLNVAIQSVRKGGKIILQKYDSYSTRQEKKFNKIECIENLIHEIKKNMNNIILKFYPNHIIHNENFIQFNKEKIEWYVKTIYGKINFINNFPYFCTAISIYVKGKIIISVVYDPIKNDLFTAMKGRGAQLNGYRTRCNSVLNFDYSIMNVNFLFKNEINYKIQKKILKKLLYYKFNIRQTGCSLLDYLYLSVGKIDFILSLSIKKNNFEAGKLHVQESGGLIYSFKNIFSNYKISGIISTSNLKFMKILKKILK